MLADDVPDSRKRGLERVKEREEAYANRLRLARVTEREIWLVFGIPSQSLSRRAYLPNKGS